VARCGGGAWLSFHIIEISGYQTDEFRSKLKTATYIDLIFYTLVVFRYSTLL
jgi:hypothetical protein